MYRRGIRTGYVKKKKKRQLYTVYQAFTKALMRRWPERTQYAASGRIGEILEMARTVFVPSTDSDQSGLKVRIMRNMITAVPTNQQRLGCQGQRATVATFVGLVEPMT